MKKYQVLVLLGVMFLLPVVLAKVILNQNWYTGGVTNRGELLTPPISAQWLAKPETWQLVYWLPQQCDEGCEGALFHLQQIPIAVGAYQDRVQSVLLVAPQNQILPTPQSLTGIERYNSDDSELHPFENSEYGFNAVYIADPHGNVMMAYPLETEQQAILTQGKDILKDLKRLLKVSKIG
ncbi:cytochrome oxidase [Photobacterium leiognathi]|uniref:cytochrome oxidase n=1 Tax=Photobacterium leiognathi TaxID=553611 RepID=UPI0027327E14|nr:cytochrome oxidase [Photobacterium leiognathi]